MRLKVLFSALAFGIAYHSFSFSQNDSIIEKSLLDKYSFEDLLKVTTSTASKTNKNIGEVPASVVIIGKSEIEKSGFHSLEEILQHVTGLYVIDDYYWLGTLNYGVRGFYSSGPFNNLYILVNGVNQMEEYTRGALLSKISIPIEAIDRIEIIRGPMSVLYGSGAFLGAINIITNQNAKNEAGVTFGTNNTIKAYSLFSKQTEDLTIQVNTGIYKTDGLDVPYTELTTNPIRPNGKTFLENNGLENNARTTNQLKETRVHMSVNSIVKNFQFDISYTGCRNGMMDGQPVIGEGSYFINNSFIIHGNYHKKIADNLDFRLKETYSYYTDFINYEQDYVNTTMGSNQISSFVESEINVIYNPVKNSDILFGLYNRTITGYHWGGNYSYWGDDFRNFLTRVENPFSFNAAFIQANFRFKKVTIVSGFRMEQITPFTLNRYNDYDTLVLIRPYTYDYNKFNIIPSLAFIYDISDKNILKILYGKAIKQPAMADLHAYCFNPDWATLEPSVIETFEINYLSTIRDFLQTNISLYYNQIDKLITRKDLFNPDGSLTIQSTNGGKMNSIGIESRFLLKLNSKLTADISGTYQKTVNGTEGMLDIKSSYYPAFLAYASLQFKLSEKINIASLWRYIDKMETYYDNTYIDPTQTQLGKNGFIGQGSPAYQVYDLNVRFDNLWKNLFVNIALKNILNTEIRYPTTTANTWIDKGTLGWGRSIFLVTGIKF